MLNWLAAKQTGSLDEMAHQKFGITHQRLKILLLISLTASHSSLHRNLKYLHNM